MSALPAISVWGGNLTPEDYANLEKRWIPEELADTAGIQRVSSLVGRDMSGRKRGDLAGQRVTLDSMVRNLGFQS